MASAPAVEYPPQPSAPPAHIRTDEEIRIAVVKGVVINPNVFAADLRVSVKEGAVTLTGTVRDEYARTVAKKVALQVPGVLSVKNLLTLRPAAP